MHCDCFKLLFLYSNRFICVQYKSEWHLPQEVWILQKNLELAERIALYNFMQKVNVQYAELPECITNKMNCHCITRYTINDWITKFPAMYTQMTADDKCNLLSFSVTDENDLKVLINSKVFTLSGGTSFQLLRNLAGTLMHYMTTNEIPPELLPTSGRCLDQQFFASNPEFLRRLKIILNKGI